MSAGRQISGPFPWYRDAVIYELHLRAFRDANRDGVGDFAGAIEKLDYLVELGVTAVWLLPFYPSPLRDDGYDISDYRDVHPLYGSLADFRRFLDAAHARGLRVITELVLNHTSDQHPWFVAARAAPPGSAARDRYVWSDSPERYAGARVIFRDFEPSNWTWDPEAKAYYWHRFYRHQPDLNFEDPTTFREIEAVAAFWLGLGVDGLRLDAAPYLCEREGTDCENLPETHAILRRLRAALDARFEGRVLLAEANQWPDDAVGYFGAGDECHLAFHFPLMPRMYLAIQGEDRRPLVDILDATPPIPEGCQWALFLRNHDELTLEMVTDEERDHMHRAYARDPRGRINLGIRRRLAPLLGGDRRKIELMELLLFTLPGTPVIYYGDEILMGDNDRLGDRNSVRTPMQWSARRNAGFSTARARNLYLPLVRDPVYRYDAVNVESQLRNLDSHLWWMKRLIRLRRRFPTFGRGRLELLAPPDPAAFAFLRRGAQDLLVVVNLSRFPRVAELALPGFEGRVPVDLFGGARFPPVRRGRLGLALGPYGYYTFLLASPDAELPGLPAVYEISLADDPAALWLPPTLEKMQTEVLPTYLLERPWLAGAGRIDFVKLRDAVPLPGGPEPAWIAVVDVFFTDASPEVLVLPLALVEEDPATAVAAPPAIARVRVGSRPTTLRDALDVPGVAERLVGLARAGGTLSGRAGRIEGTPVPDAPHADAPALVFRRRPPDGPSLEARVAEHLAARGFPHSPRLLGRVGYRERGSEPVDFALLFEGPTETESLDARLGRAIDRFLAASDARRRGPSFVDAHELGEPPGSISAPLADAIGAETSDLLARLGAATALLHRTLADAASNPTLAPVPFDYLYLASLAYAFSGEARRRLRTLGARRGPTRPELAAVVAGGDAIVARFASLRNRRVDALRTILHGDLRAERIRVAPDGRVRFGAIASGGATTKRSPLRDVSRLLRSFQEVAEAAAERAGGPATERSRSVDAWSELWSRGAAAIFLAAYWNGVAGTGLVPGDVATRDFLLQTFLLDACLAEVEGPGASSALRTILAVLATAADAGTAEVRPAAP